MKNKYPGRCAQCGVYVPADTGFYVGGRGVLCSAHAPAQVSAPAAEPVIVIDLRGERQGFVKLEGFLGDKFGAFRDAITASGCKFEPSTKGNVCSLEAASRLIQELQRTGLKVDVRPRLVEALTGRIVQVQTELQAAGVRLEAVDAVLASRGLFLFEYQRSGVQWLSPRVGALLADGQGTGKTIQTITSLPDNAPVVVVCPAVVKGVWKNEIAKWRPELKTVTLQGRGAFRWPVPGEVVIVNYDILPAAGNPKDKTDKGEHVDIPPMGCVLIADEAHFVKSGSAKRTRALKRLSALVQSKGGRVWLLTGTPLVNRPPELWSVLNCAGLGVEVFSSWPNFTRMFDGSQNRWGGWEWGQPTTEVPELLKRVMLRRVKSDVLKDLPEKMYQTVPVDIDAKYEREIEKTLKAQGTTVQAVMDAIEGAMAETGKIPFERYSAVREILARAKYGSLLEVLEPYEEANEPVLVFSAHLWPVQTLVEQKLAEGKKWGLITGADTPAAERDRIVADFQAGKLDGVALTIRAGGVGITLTRANTAIYVDSSWSPADNEQSEDRIHRIGQSRGTTIVQMIATHPIDERVHELLSIKAELIAATTEAARTRLGEAVKTSTGDIETALASIGTGRVSVSEGYGVASGGSCSVCTTPVPAAPQPPPAAPTRAVYRPAKDAVEQWAQAGLQTLVEFDPDRAGIKNEMGFNKADGDFGRQLLGTLETAGGMTDRQWQVTVKMLRKYHRQIGRAPDYVKPEAAPKKARTRKVKPEEGSEK